MRLELMNSKSGIDDIFDDDYIAVLHHLLERNDEIELSR